MYGNRKYNGRYAGYYNCKVGSRKKSWDEGGGGCLNYLCAGIALFVILFMLMIVPTLLMGAMP